MGRAGIQKMLHRLPCLLMGFRSSLAQEMNAPMDIRIYIILTVFQFLYHATGFLRSGTIVEIDQWLIIDSMSQNGKIFPDGLNVKHHIYSCFRRQIYRFIPDSRFIHAIFLHASSKVNIH